MQAVMSFDLGCPVGDAAWAPYSPTLFAAVGDDGCVQVHPERTPLFSVFFAGPEKGCPSALLHTCLTASSHCSLWTASVRCTESDVVGARVYLVQVFDLAANKRDPVTKQKIHAKASLTKLAFNTHHPILLIGDDRSA